MHSAEYMRYYYNFASVYRENRAGKTLVVLYVGIGPPLVRSNRRSGRVRYVSDDKISTNDPITPIPERTSTDGARDPTPQNAISIHKLLQHTPPSTKELKSLQEHLHPQLVYVSI